MEAETPLGPETPLGRVMEAFYEACARHGVRPSVAEAAWGNAAAVLATMPVTVTIPARPFVAVEHPGALETAAYGSARAVRVIDRHPDGVVVASDDGSVINTDGKVLVIDLDKDWYIEVSLEERWSGWADPQPDSPKRRVVER